MTYSTLPKLNIKSQVERVLRQLPDRNRDILASRFGIGRAGRETLESIGRRYNITRERVRQIEEASLSKLRTLPEFEELGSIFGHVAQYLDTKGGVLREDHLLEAVVPKSQEPYLALVLHLGGDFVQLKENDDYHAVWATSVGNAHTVQNILHDVVSALNKTCSPIYKKELIALVESKAGEHSYTYQDASSTIDHVQIAKTISKGPFDKYGLVRWPEINPRGVRDKAYLVFETGGNPLHFRDIARKIDELGLSKNPKRHTHPQTVHNELIKDDRFVLVGRGMYALVKWGYRSGTVRDVLAAILKEAGKPISRDDLVSRVLKQRIVQENTILLNLQNKSYFHRDKDGKYMLA